MKFLIISLALTCSMGAFAKAHIDKSLYENTDVVQICTIPLPVTESAQLNKLMMGTRHVYLKLNNKTYGTPYTANGTYNGGDAYLYSDDLFYRDPSMREDEKCFPVLKKKTDTEENFAKRMECIADKLSAPFDNSHSFKPAAWYPIFDYNWFKNNCASMVNYLITCSGGIDTKGTNLSVGSKVPMTKMTKIVQSSVSLGAFKNDTELSTYGAICEKAKSECMEFSEPTEASN